MGWLIGSADFSSTLPPCAGSYGSQLFSRELCASIGVILWQAAWPCSTAVRRKRRRQLKYSRAHSRSKGPTGQVKSCAKWIYMTETCAPSQARETAVIRQGAMELERIRDWVPSTQTIYLTHQPHQPLSRGDSPTLPPAAPQAQAKRNL